MHSTISLLRESHSGPIKILCICASRDGLRKLTSSFPDIEVYCACVDDELTEGGMISPGLGDAGEFESGPKKSEG
jgi:uracil phosphoribosyltransferase